MCRTKGIKEPKAEGDPEKLASTMMGVVTMILNQREKCLEIIRVKEKCLIPLIKTKGGVAKCRARRIELTHVHGYPRYSYRPQPVGDKAAVTGLQELVLEEAYFDLLTPILADESLYGSLKVLELPSPSIYNPKSPTIAYCDPGPYPIRAGPLRGLTTLTLRDNWPPGSFHRITRALIDTRSCPHLTNFTVGYHYNPPPTPQDWNIMVELLRSDVCPLLTRLPLNPAELEAPPHQLTAILDPLQQGHCTHLVELKLEGSSVSRGTVLASGRLLRSGSIPHLQSFSLRSLSSAPRISDALVLVLEALLLCSCSGKLHADGVAELAFVNCPLDHRHG